MTTHYDIVIAGGGLIGATCACALAGTDLTIALLEQAPPSNPPTHEIDLRVVALTFASQRIFEALQVWSTMERSRVSPFREMCVWDAGGWGEIRFDSAAIGSSTLGWIVENQVIQNALWQRLRHCENVTLCSIALQSIEAGRDRLELTLSNTDKLTTDLLIGADGINSRVRKLAGIASAGWEYGQQAVVATVTTENFHQETAWQRFLATGPLAFLPLHDGRCSIVWSTTPEQATTLLAMPDNQFATQLAQAFDWRLGDILACSPRATFALNLRHAHSYVRPRIALIGDAAHVVHPLAGQGANLGLLDAAALAEVISDAAGMQRDIGSLTTLRRYERWRKGDNLLMIGVMDGLKRLFAASSPPLRVLRNTGLNLTDALEPVKNRIMRQAMGRNGDLPKLARV
jgi:2-octaprenylphenol hydroxylase